MKKLCILSLMLFLSFNIAGCFGSGSGKRDVNECGSCGRKYYAGDSGGNYMKISTSGMCKNCYNNYKSTKDALDYYELNK